MEFTDNTGADEPEEYTSQYDLSGVNEVDGAALPHDDTDASGDLPPQVYINEVVGSEANEAADSQSEAAASAASQVREAVRQSCEVDVAGLLNEVERTAAKVPYRAHPTGTAALYNELVSEAVAAAISARLSDISRLC
jgi:hypothetical protein